MMNCTLTAFEDYMAFLGRPVPWHAHYVYQLFDRMTKPKGELFGGLAPLMYKLMLSGTGLEVRVAYNQMMPKDYWFFMAPTMLSELAVLWGRFDIPCQATVAGPAIILDEQMRHAYFQDEKHELGHWVLIIHFSERSKR